MVILQGLLTSFIVTQSYRFPLIETYYVLPANFQTTWQLSANFQAGLVFFG